MGREFRNKDVRIMVEIPLKAKISQSSSSNSKGPSKPERSEGFDGPLRGIEKFVG